MTEQTNLTLVSGDNSSQSSAASAMTIEMIEHGIDSHPRCACGRPTTAAVHDGIMWVECTLLSQPVEGRFRRAMASAGSYFHYRDALGELAA